jgi:hypothetical protein
VLTVYSPLNRTMDIYQFCVVMIDNSVRKWELVVVKRRWWNRYVEDMKDFVEIASPTRDCIFVIPRRNVRKAQFRSPCWTILVWISVTILQSSPQ